MYQPMDVRVKPPRNGRGAWSVVIRLQVGNDVFVGRGLGDTYEAAYQAAEGMLSRRRERVSRVRARRENVEFS